MGEEIRKSKKVLAPIDKLISKDKHKNEHKDHEKGHDHGPKNEIDRLFIKELKESVVINPPKDVKLDR